jgi:hypothetical protein
VITLSAPLSKTNAWPLFAQLYALKYCIAGMVTVAALPADPEMRGDGVVWFRPYQNVQWYPWGWEDGIKVYVYGSSYALPGLLPVDAVNGNATLNLTDGLLSGTVTKKLNISPAGVASRVPTTDASYTFTLVPSTGAISGTFTHSNATKPMWQGVLVQNGGNMGGHGYFMTVSPKVVDGTGESGGVLVIEK